MDTIQELQLLRAELIQDIDDRIGRLLEKMKAEQTKTVEIAGNKGAEKTYESFFFLNSRTSIFKGKRPTGIIFADGKRKDISTWKKLVEEILRDCNNDPEKHAALLALRGKVRGRDRVLLDCEKGRMRSPLKIDRGLYMETHYDTETLLKILTTRILDAVEYNYSNIRVAIQNK